MKLLKPPNYSDPREIALTRQNTLRKLVGVLGMLLPLLLFLFLLVDTGFAGTMPSISHYYFTRSCSVFVIIVSLLAIFLIIYKGKEKIDFYLSLIAGSFALLLLLFPTSNLSAGSACNGCVVTKLKSSPFRSAVHLTSAALFLVTLAIMAIVLFTKSNLPKNARGQAKRRRNRVFRTCGTTIILSLIAILGGMQFNLFGKFYEANHLTFWFETVAVEAFGFAWFVKGEAILKDKH